MPILTSPYFADLEERERKRRRLAETAALGEAVAARPNPGLYDFDLGMDLPAPDQPGGYYADLRGRPVLSPLVETAETIFGAERLGLTDLDVNYPTTNMVLGAASQLGQAALTLGGSAAPSAARATLPGFGAAARGLRSAVAAGETSAAARAGVGAVLGAEITARQTGLEDPVGIATGALQGAGGGILKSIPAGAAFDIVTGAAETARIDPELAERIASGEATEDDMRRAAGQMALQVVPGVAAGLVGAVAPRAGRSEAAIRQAEESYRRDIGELQAEEAALRTAEQQQSQIAMGREIANKALMEEAVETDAQRRLREEIQARQGDVETLPRVADPSVSRGEVVPPVYIPPAEQVPARQSARSAVSKARAAAGMTPPGRPDPAATVAEVRASQARLDQEARLAAGEQPAAAQRPEGYVPPQEQFFSRGAVRPKEDRTISYGTMEDLISKKMRKPMQAEQLREMLRKGGVKPETMEYSRIGELSGEVTPDQVKQHLATRAIRSREVDPGPSAYRMMEEKVRQLLPEKAKGRAIEIVADDAMKEGGIADLNDPARIVVRLNPRVVDAIGTARQEAFHVFDKSGLMEDSHRALLTEYLAKPETRDRLRKAIEADEAQGDARARILQQIEDPDEFPAWAYAYHAAGKMKADGLVGQIFDAIKEFWDRAKNLVSGKGFQTGTDVLRSFEAGSLRGDAKPGLAARATGTDLPVRSGLMMDTLDAIGVSLVKASTRSEDPSIKGTYKAIGPKAAGVIRNFLPSGGEFALAMSKKAGRQSQMEATSRNLVSRFDKAISKMTPAEIDGVFKYLRGEGDLPEGTSAEVAKSAAEFRAAIDKGSEQIAKSMDEVDPSGTVEEIANLKGAIRANMGKYIARLYRADFERKFLPKVLQDYEKTAASVLGEPIGAGMDRPDAWATLQAHFADMEAKTKGGKSALSPEDRNALNMHNAMRYILREEGGTENAAKLYNEVYQYIAQRDQQRFGTDANVLKSSGTTGGTAKNRFKKRTDMPVEFRELLGELTSSPRALFHTMNNLNAINNQVAFISEIASAQRADGVAMFSDAPDPRTGRTHVVGGDFDPITRAILGGKYTDQNTIEGLNDWRYMKGVGGALQQISDLSHAYTGAWQRSQTAWSLASHQANTLGNSLLAFLDGVSPLNPANAKYYKRALAAWKNPDSADYRRAAESGALGKQFLESGTESMMDQLTRSDAQRRGEKESAGARAYRAGRDVLGGANRRLIGAYLAEDQLFRMASFFKHLEETGSEKAAADLVSEAYPDYARVPGYIKALQRLPIAAPFLSFRFEVPRIFVNQAARHPLRMALLLMATGALTKGASIMGDTYLGMEGIPEEQAADWDKARGLLPAYLDSHRVFPRMVRDESGRKMLATTDADRIIPFGSFFQLGEKSTSPMAFATELASTTLFAGPVAEALSLLKTGTDLRGVSRIPEDASQGERGAEILKTMAQSALPPDYPDVLIPDELAAMFLDSIGLPGAGALVSDIQGGFAAERRDKAQAGAPDRLGRVESKKLSAMATLTGVRFRPTFWDADYRTRTGLVERGLEDRTARAKRIIESQTASPQEIARAAAVLEEEIRRSVESKLGLEEALRAGMRLAPLQTAQARENVKRADSQFRAAVTSANRLLMIANQRAAMMR